MNRKREQRQGREGKVQEQRGERNRKREQRQAGKGSVPRRLFIPALQ